MFCKIIIAYVVLEVNVCVMNGLSMKRITEVLFFQGQVSAAEVNNWADSSLDFQRESEWKNKGIRIGFLHGSFISSCVSSKETSFI